MEQVAAADVKPHVKPHPEYPHKANLRDKIVFADDSAVYINDAHKRDVDTQAELANIQRFAKIQVPLKFVMLSAIHDIYSASPHQALDGASKEEHQSAKQAHLVRLMTEGRENGASDLHLVSSRGKTKIQFRIHGDLYLHAEVSAEEGEQLMSAFYNSMIDSASDPGFDKKRRQQGRLLSEFAHKAGIWSGRLATTPAESGVAMVLRLLYQRRTGKPSIGSLGYLPEQIKIFNDVKRRGKGICILSGATGSGKSTTLECVCAEIHVETNGTRRVLTLEHPVEFFIEGAVQTYIQDKNAMTDSDLAAEFAAAIRHSMRLDPDVIMVGEVRDAASARAAFAAAMTGHGLLTTLHANDWLTIFDRLRDLGISDSLLFDPTLVRCLANQSLARTLCPNCRVKFSGNEKNIPDDVAVRVTKYCDPADVYLRGPGCKNCRSGITGRTVIAEVASPTRKLMEAYQKSKFAAYDHWRQQGGISKNEHLIRRINEGVICPELGELDVGLLDTDELMMA